jgi:internalin A
MMKQCKILVVIFTFLLTAMSFVGCAKPVTPTVTFPDKNLETIIRNTLDKSSDEDISSTDLAKLKELSIQNSSVSNLNGLEYCINLTSLEIREVPVTDISPLSSLTNLTKLSLCNDQISDISPLSKLFKLEWLAVEVNPLEDISPLSELTSLEILGLAGDQITDISPLASLTNLTILCLQCNEVTDISILSNLTNLTDLRLIQNNIDDISPLVENTGLGEGDSVLLGGNNLEVYEGSEDMENIKILETRGVIVSLDPEQMAPENVSPGAPRPIQE